MISATIIQRLFRSYRVRHAIHQTVPSLRSPMVIYYSSMPQTMKMKSDTDKLFQMLNHKRIRYFKLDLVDNKMAQTWVKDQLSFFDFPFVKIHDVFIGGYDEVEELISVDALDEIMKKENKEQVLIIEKHPKIQEPESHQDQKILDNEEVKQD